MVKIHLTKIRKLEINLEVIKPIRIGVDFQLLKLARIVGTRP